MKGSYFVPQVGQVYQNRNDRFNNGLEQTPQETRWPLQASGASK